MTERHPGRPLKPTPYAVCKVTDCANTIEKGAHGLCRPHYMQMRQGIIDKDGKQLRELKRVASYGPGRMCSVVNCTRRPRADGMCVAHWQRAKAGSLSPDLPLGQPRGRKPSGAPCHVSGCLVRPSSRGLCPKHAAQRDSGMIDAYGIKLRDRLPNGRRHNDGPTTNSSGYLMIVAPVWYAGPTWDGRAPEHRVVMSKLIGRPLEDWEIVHHEDGNKKNNAPENLELIDGRAGVGEGHHPGHKITEEQANAVLDHLAVNDPKAYMRLLKKRHG